MFNIISSIIRVMFLIVWIPVAGIVFTPFIVLIGMVMKEEWNTIKEITSEIILLRI